MIDCEDLAYDIKGRTCNKCRAFICKSVWYCIILFTLFGFESLDDDNLWPTWQVSHRCSQGFSKGGHTVSKWGYSPDCCVDLHAVFFILRKVFKKGLFNYGQDIVMAFLPPVVRCLVRKGLQKGGHGHPRTPWQRPPELWSVLSCMKYWVGWCERGRQNQSESVKWILLGEAVYIQFLGIFGIMSGIQSWKRWQIFSRFSPFPFFNSVYNSPCKNVLIPLILQTIFTPTGIPLKWHDVAPFDTLVNQAWSPMDFQI